MYVAPIKSFDLKLIKNSDIYFIKGFMLIIVVLA